MLFNFHRGEGTGRDTFPTGRYLGDTSGITKERSEGAARFCPGQNTLRGTIVWPPYALFYMQMYVRRRVYGQNILHSRCLGAAILIEPDCSTCLHLWRPPLVVGRSFLLFISLTFRGESNLNDLTGRDSPYLFLCRDPGFRQSPWRSGLAWKLAKLEKSRGDGEWERGVCPTFL